MTLRRLHIRPTFSAALSGLLVLLFLAVFSPVVGQNTKGDRPSSGRENRFRTGPKKKKAPTSAKRVRTSTRTKTYSNSGGRSSSRRGERVGKPTKPVFSVKPSRDRQRPWRGDITGRKIRTKSKSSVSTTVHPQPTTTRKRVRDNEGRKNVYPQGGRYVGGYSKKAPDRKPIYTNAGVNGDTRVPPPSDRQRASSAPRRRQVQPRSASRSYVSNKSINIYARFKRPKKKSERAVTKDIAGRKLRTKNYQTHGPGFIKAIIHPSQKRKRAGERPYSGKSYSGYFSTSRSGRAWRGDLSHSRLRFRNRSSKSSVEGTPSPASRPLSRRPRSRVYPAGGYRSATRSGETRTGTTPVPVKTPGLGGQIAGYRGNRKVGGGGLRDQGEGFTGFKKGNRPVKGGGTRSGRSWNNRGVPVQVRLPRSGYDVGGFRGNIKRGGRPLQDQGEGFTGFVKGHRPVKGGGSRSGRSWNNKGVPVQVRLPRSGYDVGGFRGNMKQGGRPLRDQGEGFTGFKKASRPVKGGGSVSGRLWNNREQPLQGKLPGVDVGGIPASQRRAPRRMVDQGEAFTGYKKASKPVKGGGSVSGKLWNNKEQPIQVKTPSESSMEGMQYSGNINLKRLQSRLKDQGEEFTGVIKTKKKDYRQNEHAHEESLKKHRPDKAAYAAEGLQVRVKRRDYVKNKNVAEESLLKLKPTDTDKKVAGLQVRVQRRPYVRNKNSAEDALLKLKPTKTTREIDELHIRVKQYHYVRNGSSAKDALKVREPGKAFARSTDYQGNIKMKKFSLFERDNERHPDSRFVKTNKNNVDGERDLLTNFKLWWARLFKKQENQPDHLKEKGRKPRYDTGEQGMWYD